MSRAGCAGYIHLGTAGYTTSGRSARESLGGEGGYFDALFSSNVRCHGKVATGLHGHQSRALRHARGLHRQDPASSDGRLVSTPRTIGGGSGRPSRPDPAAPRRRRRDWHRRAGLLPLGYLAAATVTAPLAAAGILGGWLVLHIVLLGAISNAIVVWSSHFAAAILHSPAPQRRSSEAARLAVLNGGILAVLTGGSAGPPWLGLAGAVVIFAAIAAHLLALAAMLRRALPARFGTVVRYYLAAGLAFLTGIPAGAWMLYLPDYQRPRILIFHAQVNVLGWVALTVVGTLLTLWPTVLRTQIPPSAERAARRGLLCSGPGLVLLAAGTALWLRPVIAAGLAAFSAGLLIALSPAVTTARQRPPRSFAALSIAAGTGWLLVAIGWDAWAILTAPSPATAASRFDPLTIALTVGFAAQAVVGALTYLLPMALGGGPAVVRRNTVGLGQFGWQRVIAANAGLIAAVCPGPAALRVTGIALLVAALTVFLARAMALVVGR